MLKLLVFSILREVRQHYQNLKEPSKGLLSTMGSQDDSKDVECGLSYDSLTNIKFYKVKFELTSNK